MVQAQDRLLDLPAAVIASWQPLLEYRWYGEPPATAGPVRLDLNQATDADFENLTTNGCSNKESAWFLPNGKALSR